MVYGITNDTPPCTVSEGGHCVGRPDGYGPGEECAITVGGTGGGVLGPCTVFDTDGELLDTMGDYITLLGGAWHGGGRQSGSDCPVGVVLVAGDALSWSSTELDP